MQHLQYIFIKYFRMDALSDKKMHITYKPNAQPNITCPIECTPRYTRDSPVIKTLEHISVISTNFNAIAMFDYIYCFYFI